MRLVEWLVCDDGAGASWVRRRLSSEFGATAMYYSTGLVQISVNPLPPHIQRVAPQMTRRVRKQLTQWRAVRYHTDAPVQAGRLRLRILREEFRSCATLWAH